MKYFTIILSFLFLSSSFAQWRVQNPHPTPNTSYIGSAPSADRYITVTGQGEAVLTHDGGATWDVVQIGGDGIYRAAYFLNDNLGWAVGSFVERLHKTTDGGLSWVHQPNAPDTTKYDVFFIDENIGWSIGFNGFIIKTTDGGNNWFSQSNTSVTSQTLYTVYATDMNTVYVAGNNDAFIKSTDGGATWNVIAAIYGTTTNYRGIYFPPTGTGLLGFAVGHRNRIVKTTDGGNTWLSVYDGGTTNQLWALDFNSTGEIGLVSGASGTLLRTTDSGNTWIPVAGLPNVIYYSVRFGADNAAYLSGGSGYFLKSTDGGATWQELGYRFTTSRIRDISFADNNTGYLVGTGFIYKSTNSGDTWNEQTIPFTDQISEVVAVTPDLAIAGCNDGSVLRTSNGGATWQNIPTGITGTNSTILAIDFADENFGLVAAYNGTVARTTDGGATWNIISTILGTSPWDMHMVDSLYAWVSGTGERIFRTTDGGLTWTQQLSVGGLGTYGISFIDRNIGVAGGTGGNTYYTNDGGETWTPAVTPPGNTVWGIHIASSPVFGSVAMTACASGYVYISKDGGRNWEVQPRFTISTMDDVWMTDAANAWFVGNSGLVLKYTEPANIPVELASFSASVSGSNVTLRWTTGSEINNSGFKIERKVFSLPTGQAGPQSTVTNFEYERIGFVEGRGTTTEPAQYSFVDNNLTPGSYQYRIKQIDFDGSFKYYNLTETIEIGLPNSFELAQNYPNPFNPTTIISYNIPSVISTEGRNLRVQLKVYDVLGNEVTTLVDGFKEAGYHSIEFNAAGLASGVYLYKLQAGSFTETKKMMLIR
ncbi:MAG TPA: YCF48-related protein [Ignavibacteriaceae bacterium]|nr:YCF48-related protein [Ignavibacteriaceae bacterium]